ncbi:universal stress protein [Actinocatenispora thailandica]|uniref:Universal stress protein n=1 Tax=Actinocatenispora thailandica TaxID=227318 RepID=A0A7R7I0H9_9ACTN|nr:universal stress protein [Actinocatenispora thailandica]BCJ39288.1 universal stress protein [Actinocatenispora thailandica]
MTGTTPGTGRIVVGVDGSEPSQRALRWALRQAQLSGARVQAIMAWEVPLYYGMSPTLDVDLSEQTGKALNELVSDAVERTRADVRVEQHVVHNNPARTLINTSIGADLLVLGTRGHGGFAEALLGSVAQKCVHFAACPVVIVPPERQ